MACGAFVSLYALVGSLPAAITGLPCCTVYPPQHATPATPGVDARYFRYFSVHPAAFPFRPEGRLLHLCYEATSRFTCVAACCFALGKLTTPDYSDAASRC
jgi:hypothetical protein